MIWLIRKIHYFGRKIGRRKKADQEEIEALAEIIEEIRTKYPNKETITPDDLAEVGVVCKSWCMVNASVHGRRDAQVEEH